MTGVQSLRLSETFSVISLRHLRKLTWPLGLLLGVENLNREEEVLALYELSLLLVPSTPQDVLWKPISLPTLPPLLWREILQDSYSGFQGDKLYVPCWLPDISSSPPSGHMGGLLFLASCDWVGTKHYLSSELWVEVEGRFLDWVFNYRCKTLQSIPFPLAATRNIPDCGCNASLVSTGLWWTQSPLLTHHGQAAWSQK